MRSDESKARKKQGSLFASLGDPEHLLDGRDPFEHFTDAVVVKR
jgi:hypothetical protein